MRKKSFTLLLGCCSLLQVSAQQKDTLWQQFLQPPPAAQPRVWWHWMNGNITQDGIRKDLLWMKRVGIGGFQNFDASLLTPQIVPNRLTYMTPDWIAAFRYTTALADSLKLEMAIAGSPGWSETGGPWVKPEDGMKKLVWTEQRVKSGVSGIRTVKPEGTMGPFQNIPLQGEMGAPAPVEQKPVYYKDVAVIAYRVPHADKSLADLGAVVSSSGGGFTLEQLTDGDLGKTVLLPRDSVKGFGWICFSFPKPVTIKAITMVGGGNPGQFGMGADAADSRKLEVSEDGVNFRFVTDIPPGAILQQTLSLQPVTAMHFRITVKNPPPQINALAAMVGLDVKPVTPPGTAIAEIVLSPAERINRFEEKAAFAPVGDLDQKMNTAASDVVESKDIIDLSSKLKADGTLDWTVPQGEWKVVRFGYSLLGIDNHPASPEATGLEVDKLDPAAISRYFNNYLGQYRKATGGLMGKKGGLQFLVTDSWEAGAQNWTAAMPAEFFKRRGYNLMPWLPVLTGTIVQSAEASEQFLYDFRHTLSEMVSEYHYDGLTRILDAWGMKRYTESHEDRRALIADGMEVKRSAAVPMAAMWTPNPFINQNNQTRHTMDIRESASVSHIYGQNLVAAESLTALGLPSGAWSYAPENLKPTVDLELAHGLNRFVIHCSPHQPVDDKVPGLGLGPFGQWYTRHETWAEQAVAWNAYLSRNCYMLQQGKMVADILYYYGEDNNITMLFGTTPPAIPEGYNYDFVNADALLNKISAKDGSMLTRTGMRYRVLVLDKNAERMSLPVLRKIEVLAKAGIRITGIKPKFPRGLGDAKNEFYQLVNSIWSSAYPNVRETQDLAAVLDKAGIAPDFSYTKSKSDTKLLYVHRKTADREIYWVNNRNARVEDLLLTFRVSGKVPELWFPDNGKTESVTYTIANGVTTLQLHFEPHDALFIVFKGKALKNQQIIPPVQVSTLTAVTGPWELQFQAGRGAPAAVQLPVLESWASNSDKGMRYFSGTGTYTKDVTVPDEWLNKSGEIWLDLGVVKNLAEVLVNDKPQGILWKAPFRVNISSALRSGKNRIEIRVTNLWVNRLIGDQQKDVTPVTYTTMKFYQANSPLLPSGLLGPVNLVAVRRN